MPQEWQVGYDKDTQTLTVVFPNGRSYEYDNVPPDIAEGFQKAESKGSFFNEMIRGVY
jgi:hypothetical protein